MNILQHLRIDGLAFGFHVSDLAANHSIDGAGGGRNFCEDGSAALRCGGRCTDGFEGQRQESVASEDGDGFAEFLMASRFAAAEVIVVQRRQIIVDQGIGVDELDGASGMKRWCHIAGEDARRLETKNGADPLSSGEDAVTHCRMDGRGWCGVGRQEPSESGIDGQAVFFEEWGKFHCCRELARRGLPWRVTIRPPARDRTARRQACHRLSSGGFPLAPLPLPVVSGTRVKGRRPLRTASWRRPKRVAGFRGGGRLLPGGQASAQNRAFSAVRVSWEQVNSRDRPYPLEAPIAGSAHKSKLTGRLAQCAGSRKSGAGCRQHSKARARTDTIALCKRRASCGFKVLARRRGSRRACHSDSQE